MTNFRHSQNPRMARKRPSRVPRTATPRKASDNRYREWSEIHNDYKLVDENGTRLVLFNGESGGTVLGPWIGPDGNRSARRNRRANLTLTPSDITWTARERQPGFFWVDGIDSEGYHYEQGLVPASSAREAIEEMESGYQFSLRRGNRNRRANRRRPHTARVRRVATLVPDWAVDNNGNKLVIGEWYKTPSDLYPQDFQFLENGTRDWLGDWDNWDNLREFLEHPKSPGVVPSDWGDHTSHRANRKRAMTDYDVQVAADAIFEFHFNNSQDEFDEIYEDDTHLVYEVIERYLDETGEEYDDYDVTDIASFIAGGNSSW